MAGSGRAKLDYDSAFRRLGAHNDSRDPARAAAFWGRLLDLEPIERDDGWYVLGPTVPGGPMLYFQPVPDAKTGKTRVHIDLWVDTFLTRSDSSRS